jgi:5-methylcytosine-specific restriction endonuclease McrA
VKLSNATVDHRIPLVEGGEDDPSNFLLSCAPCNQKKGPLSVSEFYRQIVNAPAFQSLVEDGPAVA